jgi:hypothetical protein
MNYEMIDLEILDLNVSLLKQWDEIVHSNYLPLNYSSGSLSYFSDRLGVENLSFLGRTKDALGIIPILINRHSSSTSTSKFSHTTQLTPFLHSQFSAEQLKIIVQEIRVRLEKMGAPALEMHFELEEWCPAHQKLYLATLKNGSVFREVEGFGQSLVINFCTTNQLNLRRNHIRSLKKSIQLGDLISVHSAHSKIQELENSFKRFVLCFESSTGRKEPESLNLHMLHMLRNGTAYLFESRNGDFSKSFLYCDANGVYARGWRQVNAVGVSRTENPRVLLEKFAIEFFRDLGYCSYHIGEISRTESDEKLDSINHFKLGFSPSVFTRRIFILNG